MAVECMARQGIILDKLSTGFAMSDVAGLGWETARRGGKGHL